MQKYKSSKQHFSDLVEFYQKNKRHPSYKSQDKFEKSLYSWVQSMKMAKKGIGTAKYPDWLDKKAQEHGFLDLFYVLDKAKQQFENLVLFYNTYKRKPKRYNAISKEERKLAHWVYYMRQLKSKQSEDYPDWLDQKAQKYGILNWFTKDTKKEN